MYLIEIMLDS